MPWKLDSVARSRRDFLKTAGLFGGMAAAGWPAVGHGQGLKTITASHSVSTVVYGQHLVAAQKNSCLAFMSPVHTIGDQIGETMQKLGLLTFKPQFCILVPIALIAAGRLPVWPTMSALA